MIPTHSPGPWRAIDHGPTRDGADERIGIESTDLGSGFIRVCTLSRIRNGQALRANARLVAAAPDLYEALRAAMPWFDMMWPPEGPTSDKVRVREMCRAALAKAESRPADLPTGPQENP
jgi:hypothetical protein